MASTAPEKEKDKSKVHKLSLKGSAKLVAEFVSILPGESGVEGCTLSVTVTNHSTSVTLVPILDPYDSVRAPEKRNERLPALSRLVVLTACFP